MRRLSRLVCSLLMLWLSAYAGVGAQVQWQQLPAHPRLFANATRFVALKKQTGSVSTKLKAYIQQDAEKLPTTDSIVYPATGFKFGAMRAVQGRIITLAMSYRLTGD